MGAAGAAHGMKRCVWGGGGGAAAAGVAASCLRPQWGRGWGPGGVLSGEQQPPEREEGVPGRAVGVGATRQVWECVCLPVVCLSRQ